MKFLTASPPRGSGCRLAAVLVMLLLWLGTLALEVSPELHHLLHKDARDPGHNCLVTQLQHHLLLSGVAAALTPAAPQVWGPVASANEFPSASSHDYRLSPSRAPPAV